MADKKDILGIIKNKGKDILSTANKAVQRVVDVHRESRAYYNTLEPDMKAFIDEYEKETGRGFILTSGRREPIGKKSYHHKGDAFDIKNIHTEDYEYLVNSKQGLELMSKYGLGIIDETDPQMLAKTEGIGEHFHIGKDPHFANITRQRLDKLNRGEELTPMYSYRGWVNGGNDKESFQRHFVGDGHNHNETVQQIPNATSSVKPIEQIHEWQQHAFNLWDAKEAEKEIIKESKLDQERQLLLEAQDKVNKENEQANNFLEAFANREVDIDPLADISNQSAQSQGIRGYAYEDITLQDYNPNRFIYTT